MALGLIFGTLLAAMKLCRIKIFKMIANLFTTFIRCTPVIVLIFLAYYGLPVLFGLAGIDINGVSKIVFSIIALTMYASGTLSEIIRPAYLSVDKGQIHSVTPCFRGAAFTSPQEGETEFHTHVNRIVSVGNKETELDMYSSKNPNTTTAAMQAVILDVEMPKDGKIIAEFNGKKFEHTLGELLEGSRSHFMIGWLSEAILFNRAMPESCFTLEHYMEDKDPQRDTDYYYVRVRQRDGQWAWSSPIWAERV